MSTRFMRVTSRYTLALMLCFMLPIQTAQAGMVSTEQVAAQSSSEQRARIVSFLEREEIRNSLTSHGVNPAEATARVTALTDAEVASLNQKLDELPAGGEILGILLTIFIVLLITDILGFTKVFPFTRSIR